MSFPQTLLGKTVTELKVRDQFFSLSLRKTQN
jgi:hypothetical protein